ncbi:putative glycosyltransferase RP128 [Hydrogenophilus thermoluteolus]|uniref:glycosyltransferase family 2 protein n=1 Tax=Hydrogenophilus thermoluteolus TaxID=297 RepID=UPI0024A5C4C1|nr:glycosyltransferase family 2 protein [Hydrogenophilus thermoluteolus]GLW61128.1 putative glycosyltransferase RP128 [Hydrogenophilus thermoluteolus]
MPLPLSVFIITKNEADRLPAAIASVRDWVDEVIVIDSGSEDATVAVAESLGAKVLVRQWEGYGPQKVFGERACRNDWILNLDADEAVSPELAAEIQTHFHAGEPEHAAYTVPILPIYPTQKMGHPWTAFHHPIRLYDRRRAGFKPHPVHDSVVVRSGTVGHLKGFVWHRSFRSLTHHLAKINETTTWRAAEYRQRKGKPSALTLFLLPFFAFWKSYLLRREFANGATGVLISHMYAIQRFLRVAKAWEDAERRRLGLPPTLDLPNTDPQDQNQTTAP